MTNANIDRSERPWWLEPGVEECEFCYGSVQYHALCYCHRCDRGMCLACSITIVESRVVVCSDCASEDEG